MDYKKIRPYLKICSTSSTTNPSYRIKNCYWSIQTSLYLNLCAEVAEMPLTYCRLYITSNFLNTINYYINVQPTVRLYTLLNPTHYPFSSTKYTFEAKFQPLHLILTNSSFSFPFSYHSLRLVEHIGKFQ